MGLENAKNGKILYHLTELNNMYSIIELGLQSRKYLKCGNKEFEDVADPNIITEREKLGLDEYIPFHFHPYSAFDVAVKNSNFSKRMAYICVSREYAKENGFKILPMHPLSEEECILCEYEEGFLKINWDILMEKDSKAANAKNIKMAEALSEKSIPVEAFQQIAVASEKDREYVENILKEKNITYPPPYINVQPKWFIN